MRRRLAKLLAHVVLGRVKIEPSSREIEGLRWLGWRIEVRAGDAFASYFVIAAALADEDGDEYVELVAAALAYWIRVRPPEACEDTSAITAPSLAVDESPIAAASPDRNPATDLELFAVDEDPYR